MHAVPGRSETSDPLELELQVIASRLTWVLGSEIGSSSKAIFLVPSQPFTYAIPK